MKESDLVPGDVIFYNKEEQLRIAVYIGVASRSKSPSIIEMESSSANKGLLQKPLSMDELTSYEVFRCNDSTIADFACRQLNFWVQCRVHLDEERMQNLDSTKALSENGIFRALKFAARREEPPTRRKPDSFGRGLTQSGVIILAFQIACLAAHTKTVAEMGDRWISDKHANTSMILDADPVYANYLDSLGEIENIEECDGIPSIFAWKHQGQAVTDFAKSQPSYLLLDSKYANCNDLLEYLRGKTKGWQPLESLIPIALPGR